MKHARNRRLFDEALGSALLFSTVVGSGLIAETLAGGDIALVLLAIIILGTRYHRPDRVPLSVAAVITAGYWVTVSTSCANPAISVARAVTDSFSGIRPLDMPAFVAAQTAGALCAVAAAHWLFENAA